MAAPETMKAMVLAAPETRLELREVPVPRPGSAEVLLRVAACGVCRTDLHIFDGDLTSPKLPLVLGHEIVGQVVQTGENVERFSIGDRVGVPWLGHTDGTCDYCERGQENLCENAQFTGYTRDGGFAEYTIADERYCFPIPASYSDLNAAPLLCAGLIGYRAYRLSGEHVEKLGLYGFGAAAHILTQVATHQGKAVYAFTRPADVKRQAFAREFGAVWAGDSTVLPPQVLDAAILFAPIGSLVIEGLRAVRKGGIVICAGIHMSDIPSFPYSLIWEERSIRSVANLTRQDGDEFLKVAAEVPIKTAIQVFPLDEANEALDRLRSGEIEGAAVLELDVTASRRHLGK